MGRSPQVSQNTAATMGNTNPSEATSDVANPPVQLHDAKKPASPWERLNIEEVCIEGFATTPGLHHLLAVRASTLRAHSGFSRCTCRGRPDSAGLRGSGLVRHGSARRDLMQHRTGREYADAEFLLRVG